MVSKSQRTPNPLLRLLLLPGFTSSALKFALNASSDQSGLAELDHKLPFEPWSLKPSHQLPAKTPPQGDTANTTHYTAPSAPKRSEVLAALLL